MNDDISSLLDRVLRRGAALLAAIALSLSTFVPAGAAGNTMELPISQAPPGLRLNHVASHALTLADIARIADPVTASQFRGKGWRSGYEERLEATNKDESTTGCRVLLDAFVFNSDLDASIARVIWTAGTLGDATLITHLPASARSFQALVHTPGTPGWEVQIIFRVARTFADVDGRCNGTDDNTRLRARALAARVTRRYDAWIVAHPPR